jgi:chemotaxis protein MotB
MKPEYFKPDSSTRDRWMVSYMDVLTILLIFFVAIAAHSFAAPPKPPEPPPAAAPPPPPPPPAPEPRKTLMGVQEKLEKQGLDIKLEPRGLVISLPQTILFPSGEDQIGQDALPIVAEIADELRDIPNKVTLVGHADSIPIHNRRFRNNWELSAARGLKLLELLSAKYGIPESRLSVSSDGSYSPKTSNDTPDGRASNRRVEIVILDEPEQ